MFITDLVLIYALIYFLLKRRGVVVESSKKRALLITLLLVPIKIALFLALLLGKLPTMHYSKSNHGVYLSHFEIGMHGFAIRDLTLFYPIWGPMTHGLTWYRMNYNKDYAKN